MQPEPYKGRDWSSQNDYHVQPNDDNRSLGKQTSSGIGDTSMTTPNTAQLLELAETTLNLATADNTNIKHIQAYTQTSIAASLLLIAKNLESRK